MTTVDGLLQAQRISPFSHLQVSHLSQCCSGILLHATTCCLTLEQTYMLFYSQSAAAAPSSSAQTALAVQFACL